MSDRYVFAKLDATGWYASDVTDIPAPSPEDWQAIVDAVEQQAMAFARAERLDTLDAWTANSIAEEDLYDAARAAVRNMREAER